MVKDGGRILIGQKKKDPIGGWVGFFVGVACGLLVAAVVGEWVLRIPVPTRRAAELSMEEKELQESRKNKGWDPNAALRSHGPGSNAPGQPSIESVDPSFVPLGEAPPHEVLPVSPEPDEQYDLFVQAAEFADAQAAEDLRAEFAIAGVAAIVSKRGPEGRRRYRVRLGPFASGDAAMGVADALQVKGIEPTLIRVER